MTLWRTAGAWVTVAGDVDSGELARQAAGASVRRLSFKLLEGTEPGNAAELRSESWRRPFAGAGIIEGGWLQAGTAPELEAADFAAALKRYGLRFGVVAAEGAHKFSQGGRGRSEALAGALRAAMGRTFPLGLSYLPNEAGGNDFDFGPWRRRLFRFLPQCDVPEFGAYVAVARSVERAARETQHALVHPTIYAGVPLEAAYGGELLAAGVHGFDVFHAGKLEAADWAAVGELVRRGAADRLP